MKRYLIIFFLILFTSTIGCIQETRSREMIPGRVISEELIAEIEPFSNIPENFKISPDSKHFVYLEKENDKEFIVLDGKKEKRYDDIDGFAFSPDSERLAYAANESGKWFMVVDGIEEKKFDGVNLTSLLKTLNEIQSSKR